MHRLIKLLRKPLPSLSLTLFALLATFLPALSFADANSDIVIGGGANYLFHLASNDMSIIYLGEIFGSVGSVLAGSGSNLMSTMFAVFNSGVLAVGVMFAIYTTVMGIMNSAGEGEFLGKKMSSMWVPIRTVFGIALLVPLKTSGYCVIQVFFMWMIIQGIGLADTMWDKVVAYLVTGNAVFVSSASSNVTLFDNTIQNVFEGLACQQSSYKNFGGKHPPIPPIPVIDNDTGGAGTVTYTFQGSAGNGSTMQCGIVSFNANSGSDANTVDGGNTLENSSAPAPGSGSASALASEHAFDPTRVMAAAKIKALEAVMPSLNSVAYYFISYPTGGSMTPGEATFSFIGGTSYLATIEGVFNSYIQQGAQIVANHGQNSNIKQMLTASTVDGWLIAGGYYYDIAKIGNNANQSTVQDSVINSWTTNPAPSGNVATDTQNAYDFIGNIVATRQDKSNAYQAQAGSAKASSAFNTTGLIGSIATAIANSLGGGGGEDISTNPVVSAANLGSLILILAQIFWVLTMALSFYVMLASAPVSSLNPAPWAVKAVFAFLTPMFLALIGSLMSLGGTLAVLVPMTPYIIFTFAALNWFIITIEAMVAAPIVAIGVIHPEGHEVWGKAEPAIMMLISVFLRPALLIIGMMAAMLLSYVAVDLVNLGFGTAMDSIIDNGDNFAGPVETMLFLGLYVTTVLTAMNKSFSLIVTLPNAVMGWIQGGEHASRMGGDAMQDIGKAQEGVKDAQGGMKELGGAAQSGAKEAGSIKDKADAEAKHDTERDQDIAARGGDMGGSGSASNDPDSDEDTSRDTIR